MFSVISSKQKKALKEKAKDVITLFEMIENLLPPGAKSHSQIKQDLFVLIATRFKSNGFFVEFGATDGVKLSNTFLLEKYFAWSGICAEPGISWHNDLKKNRTAAIDTRCVWSKTGETLDFSDSEDAELSTISAFKTHDNHAVQRERSKTSKVSTVSLLDLLIQHNAPSKIDYLSIDTEGSEYEILRNFDFDMFNIDIITCEHNYTPAREKIHMLLKDKGYVRLLTSLSRFDDWYVRGDFLE